MNRATALVLVGVVLLVGAAATPLVGLATAQWDTDYVYTVGGGDSYCATVVHQSPDVEGSGDYRVDHANLSTTGRRHFERALADGRYVVEDEAAVAPDFVFADDHVAAGEGCYAVAADGETYALRTSKESHRVGSPVLRRPLLVGGLLLALGIGSLLAGVGLTVTRATRE